MMDYTVTERGVSVRCDVFDLQQTVECGQFFRYRQTGGGYIVISGKRRVYLRQEDGGVLFHGVMADEFEGFWADFFDLRRDYDGIRKALTAADAYLREAVRFAPGIRILNQDPWECLLGFILSQRNRIPAIIRTAALISERFGAPLGDGDYSLPGPEVLAHADESALRACKAGYRASYIIDAARRAVSGQLWPEDIGGMTTRELRRHLMLVKGVGEKVADCVMLFSLGRGDVFPVDVWVERAVRARYFGGRAASLEEIRAMAAERFGQYAGFAQQFLFHMERTENAGKVNI